MKFLIDFIPIILFFVAYKYYDIYTATAVAIIASVVQTLWHRFSSGKFENMHLITLAIIVVLGGMTLLLQDERFIKWKPSIVNWAFGAGIIIANLVSKKSAISLLLGSKITLPNNVWKKLDIAWFAFFIFSGLLNLYVAYAFSTDIWVNFKLFGMMGLTFAFIVGQSIYLSKYLKEPLIKSRK